jgi:hypothetical protein
MTQRLIFAEDVATELELGDFQLLLSELLEAKESTTITFHAIMWSSG